MKVGRIEDATHNLGAPVDWDEVSMGHCGLLPVKRTEDKGLVEWKSLWLPTPAELALLNEGGNIVLHVFGVSHPPVMVTVQRCNPSVPRTQEELDNWVPPEQGYIDRLRDLVPHNDIPRWRTATSGWSDYQQLPKNELHALQSLRDTVLGEAEVLYCNFVELYESTGLYKFAKWNGLGSSVREAWFLKAKRLRNDAWEAAHRVGEKK